MTSPDSQDGTANVREERRRRPSRWKRRQPSLGLLLLAVVSPACTCFQPVCEEGFDCPLVDGGSPDTGVGERLCLGVVCEEPPAPSCSSATEVTSWAGPGSCDPTTGSCVYPSTTQTCAGGTSCDGGACVGPVAHCGPDDCAGCCSGATCVPIAEETELACGSAGASCTACSAPTPTCTAGACAPITLPTGTVAAGYHVMCAIVDGGAQCWSPDGQGPLGTMSAPDVLPSPVDGLSSGVTAIATSGGPTCPSACAIVAGAAWCWGDNTHGGLGNGTNMASPTPVPVSGLSAGVTSISVGECFACAVMDGGVWCWGEDDSYQLGAAVAGDSNVPEPVVGLSSGVTQVATAGFSSCAIMSGGAWCWGTNYFGQLGNGRIGPYGSIPEPVEGLGQGVTLLGAGGQHMCAIVADGGVFCWGMNNCGQLGIGSQVDPMPSPIQLTSFDGGVTAIAGGWYHTCAIVNGGLQCWGDNSNGQLGVGYGYPTSLSPVSVVGLSGEASALAVSYYEASVVAGGSVQYWGAPFFIGGVSGQCSLTVSGGWAYDSGTPIPVPGWTDVFP